MAIQQIGNNIQTPPDFPTSPKIGKIQLLWDANNKGLYSKLSPYSNYSSGILAWGDQPFVWTSVGDKSFPNTKYDSRAFPIASSIKDVIRVSKFLVSGAGIGFIAKQFLLQTGATFNECRIWNPLSPIIAAGRPGTLGIVDRPNRNFDTSGGLAGIVGALGGSNIQSSIFGAPKINPPSGTTGTGALPTINVTTDGKGLLRAQTANTGKGLLGKRWGQPNNSPGFLSSLFSNFIPQNQSGITYRSDEGAYGLMISDNIRLSYTDVNGASIDVSQLWVAGGKVMRKNGQYPSWASRWFINPEGTAVQFSKSELSRGTISGVGSTGYDVHESTNTTKDGVRYGDAVGTKIDNDYKASDIMVQYGIYVDPTKQYPTKRIDTKQIDEYNTLLGKVLSNINNASGGDLYDVNITLDDSRVISNPHNSDPANNGYNRIFKTKDKSNPRSGMNYPLGVLRDYRNNGVSMVSNDLVSNVKYSKKLPTGGQFDAINTLEVLGKDKKINNSKLKSWDAWDPYKDDLIALYFYDVVNEKYIPFRAAIKGLSESANASWEEMSFIGRGDKVYSYGGFNRNLSVTINIVISSLIELAPTWQRINYLTTLVKPANYTTSNYNGAMNRFMVPPMVMLTLGDMYKDQPVLIQSVQTSVPDDAIWETQHQISTEQWKYLADYMSAPSTVLFGQLPRTVDINLGLILLEKERAIVGGANFGHAPRNEELIPWNTSAVTTDNSRQPTKLHQSLVVDVVNLSKASSLLLDAGTPFNNTQQNSNIA